MTVIKMNDSSLNWLYREIRREKESVRERGGGGRRLNMAKHVKGCKSRSEKRLKINGRIKMK